MSIATGQINIQNIDETLSVSLSSDSHVFPGAVSTALAGQVDVEVEAFLGAKQIDCSIDAVTPTPPKGLTITVVPTQSKTKIVRFAAATNLSQSGTYNIYVNAAGTTVKKTFSYAIAFKGNTGNTGPKGATGVGVSSITEYYLATAASSGVTSGAGAWSTTIQTITADKKYLWNYEKVNFDDGTSSPTLPVIIGVYGDKGDTGKTGNTGRSITKIEEFYLTTSASSGVVRTSGAWLPNPTPTTPTNKYLWNYERITWSSGTTPTYVEPFIIGIHGDEGKKGDPGKGISSATVTYQAGSSGTVAPTGTWSTTIPAVAANQYLWTRTVITYTDNKTSTAYAVGKMGAQGPQGNTGPTGNGIDSTKVTYQASSSGTVAPTGTWQTTVPSVADNQYLWTRVVINYTSGSPTTSYSVGKMGAQGPQGARGPQGVQGATGKQGPIGDTGTSVSSIVEWYLATNLSSGVTTSTDGWKTTMQSMTATKKYLWNYEVINFSDGSSSPTIPVIIGVYGNTGATGRALTGITEYYLASATASGVTRPSTDGAGGWTTTMQPTSISKPYLWNYEKLTWSVTPTTTYVEPIVIGVHGPQGPQGPQGSRGPQGIQGPIGPDGKATYTWIKYADTPTTGMKDLPDGKKYMGIAHNKPTATESTAYGDYTWSLIQGPQGNQGVQGPIGPNGQPTYTWIKYADTATGSGMNDSPTGKRFLGLAHNKTTATESTKASDYQWSPLYDNVEVGGRNLLLDTSRHEKTVLFSRRGTITETGYNKFTYQNQTNANSGPLILFSSELISGENYTLSFNVHTNINTTMNYIYTRNNMTQTALGGTNNKLPNQSIVEGNNKIEIQFTGSGENGIWIALSVSQEAELELSNLKLEKGNIATDWTPAPEDVEERLVSHDARIDTNEREIALRATTAAVGSIDTRLKAAELKVTADAITSTVRKSTEYINDQGKKVSTNEIISKINQSAEKITIEASKINIKGKVTFESFDSSTAAEINSKARTFVAKPTPPYSAGDIWKDGTTTKISKTTRSSGSYVASDWEKTGDVTSANKAADTAKVGGTAATTVVTGATAGSAAKTATDRWTYTGKTTINGGQIQADTVTATQIKAKTITASEIAANTITVDQLASSVGGSLNLSSNEAITSRVTSTQLSTALNGKEDSIFKQSSAPAHKVGRLWLDTSTATNQLKRSDGTKWVVISDVQVGGRNLVLNTSMNTVWSGYNGVVSTVLTNDGVKATWGRAGQSAMASPIPISMETNTYTLSFEARGTVALNLFILTSPTPNTSFHSYLTDNLSSTEFKKFIVTFPYNGSRKSVNLFIGGSSSSDLGDWVEVKKNSVKLEKGNIATDWTPAPEDIQADMGALAKDIGDVSGALTTLDGHVNGAFHDGIISQAEARAIEKYVNVIEAEKADVDAKYTKLYANSLLAGTAKTGLYSAKSSYDTAHINLITAIVAAIRDGKATSTEKNNVDSKFTAYKTALTNLSTAFETASAYLVDAVNGKIVGRNLIVLHSSIPNTYIHQTTGLPTPSSAGAISTDWIKVEPSTTYVWSVLPDSVNINTDIGFFDANKTFIRRERLTNTIVEPLIYHFTTTSSTSFLRVSHKNLGVAKLEKGNIATDWTPALEDIQADIDVLAGEIGDVSGALTTLDGHVKGAFKDGIISEAEARAIEKYLNIVSTEKADVDAKYTKLYANTLLAGAAKTDLLSKKNLYNTAHTNLITVINNAIRGGTASNAEKTDVDAKFTAYRTALTNLSTAFETASAYLVSAVNGRFDGPTGVLKRLTEAESKVTDDAIIGTVSQKTTSDGKPLFAKTSEVKQAVDTWTAKFSSIGGVNLLKGTESTISNTSYPTATYTMAENMVAGQKYTITIWGQLGAGKSSFTAYLNGGSIQLTTIPLKSTGVYRATFTGRAGTTPNPNIINIYPMPSGVSATSRIDKVQLEKGEVGTEWTPHPDELYTGVTKINKDGVTVGIEGETIEANLRFDGIEIKDGATPIASFTGSGASIKNLKADSISGDVVNTLSSSVTLNVGKAAGYFATVEQALDSTNNAKYLGLGVVLTINIYDILNEDVYITGFAGGGRVVVNLHGRINGLLRTTGNSCPVEIYGKTTGNVVKGRPYPFQSSGDSMVHLDNIVADAMGHSNGVGFLISDGSKATLRGADIVNSQDGIYVQDGSIAQISYARGNVTRYGVFSQSGVAFIKATVPTSGNTAIARAAGGFVVQDGTPSQENSRFSPPPTTTGPETRTFNHTDIYTYSVKYGAKSTHYGKAAAQNRWDTSMTQMKGRIVFGSSVYSFIAGRNSGTTPTVKIRLRRQNSSHGSSSSVKPTPEWSGAPSFGGATRGNWTGWVTIPYTLFKSSGYEFSFYNGSTGNSYAIWDRAEVQITRTITQ